MFPFRAMKILDTRDGCILTTNSQHLKPVATNEIEPGMIESINLGDLVYYD